MSADDDDRHAPQTALCTVACRHERSFDFEPAQTALLVIDMQRHFLTALEVDEDSASQLDEDAGSDDVGDYVDAREIIPRVEALLAFARQVGLTIIHTREGYSADLSDVSSFRRDLDYVGFESPLGPTLIRGTKGHDFVDELRPLAGEKVIDKASFGAFYKTDLNAYLTAQGISHLLLAGVTTQCCVHSTLREAVDHGYWCLTVADCCAASEQHLHDAALALIAGEGHLFGWIADAADVAKSGVTVQTVGTS